MKYMEMGGIPIPIAPGEKRPRSMDWQHGVFKSAEQIEDHWRTHPDDGVGLVAGEQAGLFVLDIDVKTGGLESLDALVDEHGPLPDTVTARTGGGGFHYLFTYPQGHKIKNRAGVKPGIDIRAGYLDEGGKLVGTGQIVVFPSIHPSGTQYSWLPGHAPWDMDTAEAPAWLVELIETPSAPRTFNEEGRVPEGKRHEYLKHHAARLRGMGYEVAEIEPMLEGLFALRCDPDPSLTQDEIHKLARWFEDKSADMAIYSAYGTRLRDLKVGVDDDPDASWQYTGESIELGKTSYKAVELPWRDSTSVIDYPEKVWWWNERIPHPASLLKHGDAKAGKTDTTFALLDAAFHEQAFLGDYATGFTPRILYLEEEGAADVKARLDSLGWTPDQCRSISIDEVYGLDWMTLMASVIDEAERDGRNLVVVDTLSVYLQLGATEKADLFSFAGNLKPLFSYAKHAGISLWFLHHDNASGKVYRRNEIAAAFDILLHHRHEDGTGVDEWVFDGRYFGKKKPQPIQYVYDNLTGQRNLLTHAVVVKVDRRTANIQDTIEYLQHHPEGVEWAEVSDFLGSTPRKTVAEYLDLAVERIGGRKEVGVGRGNPTRWYPHQVPEEVADVTDVPSGATTSATLPDEDHDEEER